MATQEKLGEFLVKKGKLTAKQLESALAYQKQFGGRLGTILVAMNYIGSDALLSSLSEYFQVPALDTTSYKPDPSLAKMINFELAKKIGILPIKITTDAAGRKVLQAAMKQPNDLHSLDQATFATNHRIVPLVATDKFLDDAIDFIYSDGEIVFATFDGRMKASENEAKQREPGEAIFVHDDESLRFSDDFSPFDSPSINKDSDSEISFDPSVDAKAYLRYLIKVLLDKGVLKPEDIPDLIKS